MKTWRPSRFWLASMVAVLVGLSPVGSQVAQAQSLPPGVSDIIRDLSELRDKTWYMFENARGMFATNQARLGHLNLRYIEASAAANSLIEQFQLETVARTTMNPRRYQSTLERVRQRCESFNQEYHLLMDSETVRTRSGSARATTGTTGGGATEGGSLGTTGAVVQESVELAARTMSIADGLLGLVTKHRRAFRELDAQQRQEVRNLLEQRKWRPLDRNPSSPEAALGNDASIRQSRIATGAGAGRKE